MNKFFKHRIKSILSKRYLSEKKVLINRLNNSNRVMIASGRIILLQISNTCSVRRAIQLEVQSEQLPDKLQF